MRKPSSSRFWAAAVAAAGLVALEPPPATARIEAQLEEPSGRQIAAGIANVRGWAFSTTGAAILSPLEVFLDGKKAISVPCCGDRGDVKDGFPSAPLRSGFSGAFNWGLLEPGSHVLRIVVRSAANETKTLETRFTSVRTGEISHLQNLRFSAASQCEFGNDEGATIECSNVQLIQSGEDGVTSQCPGTVAFRWEPGSQAFKQVSDCR